MNVIRIERFDDPRLEDYRKLSDADLLRRRNLFVGEGRLVVGRVLESGQRVVSALLNEVSFRALEPALSQLSNETPVYVCHSSEFESITGFNFHRGCLALAERPVPRSLDEIVHGADLLLVLEGVGDADNVGSVFRNAAAFGADGVWLSPTCCDPLYRKAIRTSMASVLRTPFGWSRDWPGDLASLQAQGFTVVALTPGPQARPLSSYARPPGQKLACLVGSESSGLTKEVEALADVCLRIPIGDEVDSLNLATATGIALYHFANP